MKPWSEMGTLVVHNQEDHERRISVLEEKQAKLETKVELLIYKTGLITGACVLIIGYVPDVLKWLIK